VPTVCWRSPLNPLTRWFSLLPKYVHAPPCKGSWKTPLSKSVSNRSSNGQEIAEVLAQGRGAALRRGCLKTPLVTVWLSGNIILFTTMPDRTGKTIACNGTQNHILLSHVEPMFNPCFKFRHQQIRDMMTATTHKASAPTERIAP